MKKDKIFISAYSKLPEGISANKLYMEAAMAILVDRNTGQIYDIECTLATDVARKYIRNIIINRSINEIDNIVQDIEDNYFGNAKKSIIAALTKCYKRYMLL